MRNKQLGFGLVEVITVMLIVGLIGTLGYVGYSNLVKKEDKPAQFGEFGYIPDGKPFPPLVSGALYSPEGMSSQEVVEYSVRYAEVPGLRDALDKIAEDNPCSVTEGRFKQIVLGVTEDQTQAIIGNGCGSTGFLRSFMVKQNGEWIRVGASNGKFSDQKEDTSNFNMILDTPECEIVDAYEIQKTIAPVCFVRQDGESSLFAGDNGNYRYVLR